MEEARVEMAAAMICNTLGLPMNFENHSACIQTWLRKLQDDRNGLWLVNRLF
jgi:antirestriction protein ArdC